jgi:hypothetical protein
MLSFLVIGGYYMREVILFVQLVLILSLLHGCGLFSNNMNNAPLLLEMKS